MSTFYNNDYILNKRKIAYTYNVTTAAAALAISLTEVKEYLKLDASDTSEDATLTLLIGMATELAEKYTGRDLINKSYTTFRDGFFDPLELRRAKVSSITSINYLVANVFTLLATSVYGLQDVNDYPYIYLKDNQSWPDNVDILPQAVKIIFVSGYGTTSASIPAAIRMGLLQNIAGLYTNRGDCGGDYSGAASGLSANIKTLYNPYRIINIGSYDRDTSNYRL